MSKDSIEKIPKKEPEVEILSRGDEALEKGDLSAAYIHYVNTKDIEGLYRVAKSLEGEGREKDAAKVLAEAARLTNLDK